MMFNYLLSAITLFHHYNLDSYYHIHLIVLIIFKMVFNSIFFIYYLYSLK